MIRYLTLALVLSVYMVAACASSPPLAKCDDDCIYNAIRHDKVHKIREVIYDETTFKTLISYGHTDPLFYSATANACAVGSYFIDKFYGGEETVEARNKAYLQAAARGAECIVRNLLTAGINIDYTSLSGANALYYALESERSSIAMLLLDSGIDVFTKTDNNENLMFAVALSGDVAIAKRLIQLGVTPDAISNEGKRPSDHAAFKWTENSDIYEFLIKVERKHRQTDEPSFVPAQDNDRDPISMDLAA